MCAQAGEVCSFIPGKFGRSLQPVPGKPATAEVPAQVLDVGWVPHLVHCSKGEEMGRDDAWHGGHVHMVLKLQRKAPLSMDC